MPPSHICMLSISHSSRQVPGTRLHGSCALQAGVGGKDQAQLSLAVCSEVKEPCCCLPQMYCLLLGQGLVGYQLKINNEYFIWLS